MTSVKPSRSWCFTLSNYTDEHLVILQELKPIYIIYGKEIAPTTGTPHLQGYIYFQNAKTLSAVKKTIGIDTIHLDAALGTAQQNRNYCTKEDTNPFEYGVIPKDKRENLTNVNRWAEIQEALENHEFKSYGDLARAYIEYAVKYPRGLQDMFKLYQEKYNFNLITEYGSYNPFQQEIMEHIENFKPDRRLLWVANEGGNLGKSQLATHLATNNNFLVLSNAKTADIAYAWQGQNVIFDFSRSQQDMINYGVIENLLDGRIFSPKYESGVKIYPKPIVIVFSNFYPDTTTMSADRWNVIVR